MSEYEGKVLKITKRNNWEFVERINATGIVGIIAITDNGNIVLIKQYREPLQKYVIEIPAGIIGDIDSDETAIEAARRELLEETGYYANKLEDAGTFPISPGLSTEQMTYVIATGLEKRGEGGGEGSEQIEVFEFPVPLAIPHLMETMKQGDILVGVTLMASLLFAYRIIGEKIKSIPVSKETQA